MKSAKWTRLDVVNDQLGRHQPTECASKKASIFSSIRCSPHEEAPDGDTHAIPNKSGVEQSVDLATRVNGLYRILELTTETRIGGLGAKPKLLSDDLWWP
jgi:hypothetical protein